jgi:hypothetical protein
MNIRDKTTEELRGDIAETRQRVAAEVDAIDNKLTLRHFSAEAKLAARKNPIPVAVAGAVLATLVVWAVLRLAGVGRA